MVVCVFRPSRSPIPEQPDHPDIEKLYLGNHELCARWDSGMNLHDRGVIDLAGIGDRRAPESVIGNVRYAQWVGGKVEIAESPG